MALIFHSKWTSPFPKRQILDSSKLKELADNDFKFDENGRKSIQMGRKHWEKEKLLITSKFSFSHGVFKILLLQTRKNQGLFGKGLNRICYGRLQTLSVPRV